MFRILIIDDNVQLLESLDLYLTRKGYNVVTTSSAVEGLMMCSEEIWDLVLSDFYMDDMDGNTFLKLVNNLRNSTRVAIFTGQANEEIEYEALNNYAVDFIHKTSNPEILLKRIENILEGSKVANIKLIARNEQLIMDIENRTVQIEKNPIDLSNTEFNILKLLLENKNKVLEREFIYSEIWKSKNKFLDETRVIDVHVLNLRKKLGVDNIITKKGIGYLWEE